MALRHDLFFHHLNSCFMSKKVLDSLDIKDLITVVTHMRDMLTHYYEKVPKISDVEPEDVATCNRLLRKLNSLANFDGAGEKGVKGENAQHARTKSNDAREPADAASAT